MADQSPGARSHEADLGHHIRTSREAQAMSLRTLARLSGISASALSQIETGKTRPTAKTAHTIAQQLGMSLAELSTGPTAGNANTALPASPAGHRAEPPDGLAAHLRNAVEFIPHQAQRTVKLQGGETFRVLSGHSLPGASGLLLTYDPGASSPPDDELVSHAGHEFNYLVSGRLVIEVGSESYHLTAGDTLTFPASTPHRLSNPWLEMAELLSFFIGTAHPSGASGLP